MAVLVAVIHTVPATGFGLKGLTYYYLKNGPARMAVPVFFIIAGYHFYRKLEILQSVKDYMIKVFSIFLLWQGVYLVLWLPGVFNGKTGFDSGIQYLLLGYGPLWYLSALTGALALGYFLRHLTARQKLCTGGILYAAGYIIWVLDRMGYSGSVPGNDSLSIHTLITRHFLFMGLPFVLAGMAYHETRKIHTRILAGTGLLACIAETILYFKCGLGIMDFTLSAPILAYCAFDYAIKNPDARIVPVPHTLPAGIYLLHFGVLHIINSAASMYGIHVPVPVRLLSVLAISVLLWLPLQLLNRRVPALFG